MRVGQVLGAIGDVADGPLVRLTGGAGVLRATLGPGEARWSESLRGPPPPSTDVASEGRVTAVRDQAASADGRDPGRDRRRRVPRSTAYRRAPRRRAPGPHRRLQQRRPRPRGPGLRGPGRDRRKRRRRARAGRATPPRPARSDRRRLRRRDPDRRHVRAETWCSSVFLDPPPAASASRTCRCTYPVSPPVHALRATSLTIDAGEHPR